MKLPTSLFVTALTLGASASITNVRDIFEHSCVECHNEKKDKGGLRMDLKANFFEGGDSGSPVDFKTPDQSELLRRVLLAHDDDEFMPPSSKKKERKPLTQEEIARLKNWIVNGAKWDEKITLQHRERSTTKEDYSKPDPDLASIAVYPTSITLETKRDFHRLIILATDKNAVTRNVTSSVKFTIADPSLTRIEGSTLFPIKDGATTVNISFRGKALTVPVVIKNAVKDRRVSFQQDVVPVFTAAGCNTGACHGSARGQDGFMISLFGYDPKGDYQRVTREFAGRRINLALPEESLLLTKTIGTVPHTGGKLFEKDSPFYSTLLEWIKDGANYDPAEIALPVKIEVEPKEFLL
ncbi:cell surface protein, partial [bacterium]|nr:cell surface protein [bacterium]